MTGIFLSDSFLILTTMVNYYPSVSGVLNPKHDTDCSYSSHSYHHQHRFHLTILHFSF